MLPPYPGPYSVGIAPFEIAPDGENAFGVMGSLFYPADLSQVKAPVKSKWLLGPSKLYAVGFGTYAGLPKRFNETVLSWYLDSAKIPSILSPPVVPASTLSGPIPVVVFCHGLAGNQTSYSQFCGSLASKGMIVLAIEHRDGSTTSARNNYQDKIEYVRPPPGSEEILFRQNQLVQRVAEVKGAVKLLHQINDGRDIHNLLGHRLPSLQGRLDCFGGATAIGVLQESNPFIGGVILDPWMLAVQFKAAIPVPLLSIQSETFHWRSNLESLRKLWDQPGVSPDNLFAVVKGTNHNDLSDFPLIAPSFLKSLFQGGSLDGKVLQRTYHELVCNFLKRVWEGKNSFADSLVVSEVSNVMVPTGKAAWDLLERGKL